MCSSTANIYYQETRKETLRNVPLTDRASARRLTGENDTDAENKSSHDLAILAKFICEWLNRIYERILKYAMHEIYVEFAFIYVWRRYFPFYLNDICRCQICCYNYRERYFSLIFY